jgi:hypothetical protein
MDYLNMTYYAKERMAELRSEHAPVEPWSHLGVTPNIFAGRHVWLKSLAVTARALFNNTRITERVRRKN